MLLEFVYCVEERDLEWNQEWYHIRDIFGLASSSASPGLGLGALDWATDCTEGARRGGISISSVYGLVKQRAFRSQGRGEKQKTSKKRRV